MAGAVLVSLLWGSTRGLGVTEGGRSPEKKFVSHMLAVFGYKTNM